MTEDGRTLKVLSGVRVDFPYDPYQVQLDFMQRAINALLSGENALLESPTGTGKTLCLLCASLSWQRKMRREAKKPAAQAVPVAPLMPGSPGAPPLQTPDAAKAKRTKAHVVIYASRTHGQLAQVIAELRKTTYKPKVTLLGSRDQLCVNDNLKHLKGFALNNACSRLISQRSCLYRNNLDMYHAPPEAEREFLDIEDLVRLGKQQHVCPYFMSRDALAEADLVLMPYNYLFDPAFRNSVSIGWKDAALLLDEAHNVESVACEAASSDVSTTLLGNCLKELREILTNIRDGLAETVDLEDRPTAERVLTLYNLVNDFVTRITQQPLQQRKTTLPGRFLLNTLGGIGVTIQTFAALEAELKKCVDFMLNAVGIPVEPKLSGLLRLLRLVFRSPTTEGCAAIADAYKIMIEEVDIKDSMAKARVLHYWCFSPHIAFEELKNLGVRSFIFTSGTLSPMASYVYEFRQPFPIRLENPHVIGNDQVWVGTLTKGPKGLPLLSTFNNRSNQSYQLELGESILRILQLVNGGVLVFFPSYTLLDTCIAAWKKSGLADRMTSVMPVIVEPRSSIDMRMTIANFDAAINDQGKCALFAVCRGKVSEGIDFKDNKARAVIVTGIPFAPAKDPKVEMKKQYLDETRESQRRQCGGYLDGTSWYMQSATRAVNQAVGRVIRHKRDWGAIILLDQRFAEQRYSAQLSAWLRTRTQAHDSFAPGVQGLSTFLRNASSNPTLVQSSEPDGIRRQRLQRDVPDELVEAESRTSTRSRMAVIDGATLEQDTSFVEPDLLLTQNTSTVSWASKTVRRPVQTIVPQYESASQSTESPDEIVASLRASLGQASSHNVARSTQQRKEQSLASLFQKRPSTQPAAAQSGTSHRQTSLTRNHSTAGGLMQTSKSSLGVSRSTLKAGLRGQGLGLGSSGADWDTLSDPVPSLSQSRNSSFSQQTEPSMPFEPEAKAASSGGQQEASSTATQQSAQSFLVQLRQTLDPEVMAQFRQILQKFKQDGGLSDLRQVAQFAKSISSLFKTLPLATATDLAKKMVSFVPEQFQAAYVDASERLANAERAASKPTSISKPEATKNAVATSSATAPATAPSTAPSATATFVGDFRQPKPAVEAASDQPTRSLGSKRSMAMQSLVSKRHNPGTAQGGTATSSRLLDTLSNMKIPSASSSQLRSTGTATSSDALSSNKGQNLVCVICDTQATRPAAARCGHVCCEDCWRSWLKQGRETCVLCRKPTTLAELTRLIVR